MDSFVQRHQADVIGVLSGFDRVLFRGTLRSISYAKGLDRFLGAAGVRYNQYSAFVQKLSAQLKAHAQALAEAEGRPYVYVSAAGESKEDRARQIAERDGVTEGLVCVLRCVEPCRTFSIRRRSEGGFGFISQDRKCLHLYFYFLDREFGLMHVRLSTWVPFGMQVCLNGRSYLACQMRRAGIGFQQRENCFVQIDDLPRAQTMLSALATRRWAALLGAWARRVNPLVKSLGLRPYYWSGRQSEYATDVMFRDTAALQRAYPSLVDHAIKRFASPDVLRFLGRRTNSRFNGEVSTSLLARSEGIRVKHRVEDNSIKMYDKQGSVLRIETTLNNVRRFKVRRMTVRKGVRAMRWIPMRKGVSDFPRRVQVSRAANERYLEALAMVDVPAPAKALLDAVSRPVVRSGRRYRGLRPIRQQDAGLFEAVLHGEFLLQGFTHRQLRQCLHPVAPRGSLSRRRLSGRITRQLGLLRAHRLIRKVSGTRRYRVTPLGQRVMSAALKLRDADVAKLAA